MSQLARNTVALCLSGLILVPGASAKAEPVWREAFQSSPAAYEPPPPEMLRAIAERMKSTPEVAAERMKPQPIVGTVRYRVTVTGAGSQLRIRISNEEGETPLRVAAASVALAGNEFDARPGTLKTLAFGGAAGITLPPGAPGISDPVDLPVAVGADLIVSVSVATPLMNDPRGGSVFAFAPGDQTGAEALQKVTRATGRPAVTAVSVYGERASRVIVAMGDSITDGNRSTTVALNGWPEQLARRLAQAGKHRYTVVNAGISGNRLLSPGWGDAALARLDRDALRIEGLSHLILLEGINDIGMAGKGPFGDSPEISADHLIAGYRQVIARGRAAGAKVILGTLTAAGGSSHSSPEKDAIRDAVNRWIRTSGEPDAVIDFDRVVGDPTAPGRLSPRFDPGDHLHPNDAGYTAMGDAIDLALFP